MLKRFIFFTILILVLSGCSNSSQSTAPDYTNIIPRDDSAASAGDVNNDSSLIEDGLVVYTNKAVGYGVSRPDKWYWRHYTKGEIGDTDPLVDDYLVADPDPLIGLGSEYLGRIVIAVYSRPLSDFADAVQGLSVSKVEVSGIDASRYAGLQNNLVVSNQKVIEYQFEYNDRNYRITYAMQNSTPEDEIIFEKVVSSFSVEGGQL